MIPLKFLLAKFFRADKYVYSKLRYRGEEKFVCRNQTVPALWGLKTSVTVCR
jgi:hypothetical protein